MGIASLLATKIPTRPPVPAGKTRICIAGFSVSHNVGRAQKIGAAIAAAHPDAFETWHYFSNFGFGLLMEDIKAEIPEDQKNKKSTLDNNDQTMGSHHSAPFVWLEKSEPSPDDAAKTIRKIIAIGGRDMFCVWAQETFKDESKDTDILALCLEQPPLSEMFGFDKRTPGGTYLENQTEQ